jgi:hypothetical protein
LEGNALVDDGPIVDRVVVDDRGALINILHFRPRQLMASEIAVGEIPHRHKCEVIRTQTKIEVHRD